MSKISLPWLIKRPIAHRGLHDAASGVIENSPSAIAAAIEYNYAIEIDIQMSLDGEAFVFHDERLDRLTASTGNISSFNAQDLKKISLHYSTDRLWSLSECLALVKGRVPLIIEVKSNWTRAHDPLVTRIIEVLGNYSGQFLVKSFDPRILKLLRHKAPDIPRGIIGCAFNARKDWSFLDAGMRFSARNLLHWAVTRPHALSWDVHDLPRLSVAVAQRMASVPLISWTVRTPADQARAQLYADQMIFEGFKP
jgi:glycerophosphoryl diester phosphodiesterase